MNKQIGLKIKMLRKNKGLTQKELAKNIGITQQTLCGYEKSTSQPDIEILKKIADFFRISTDKLLGSDNQNNKVLGETDIFFKKLNEYGRQLNSSNQDIIIGTMAQMIKEQTKSNEEKESQSNAV